MENERVIVAIIELKVNKNDTFIEAFDLDKFAKKSKGFSGVEIEECVKEERFKAYTKNRNEPCCK